MKRWAVDYVVGNTYLIKGAALNNDYTVED